MILAVAAWMRLDGVTELSVRYDDEAAYANDARLWYRCLMLLGDIDARAALVDADSAALDAAVARHGVDLEARYAKPCQGYTLCVSLFMLLTGDTLNAPFVFNALAGVLTVGVIYLLGAAALGRPAGLAAAALLAVSPYHIVYSRSALADAFTTLLLSAAIWIWVLARRRRIAEAWCYLLCGLLLGWAASCHFRSLALGAFIVAVDALAIRPPLGARASWAGWVRAFWRRWRWGLIGLVAMPLGVEVLFRAARYTAVAFGYVLPLATFVEGYLYWMRLSIQVDLGRPGVIFHPQVWRVLAACVLHWQGAFWALACLVGCAAISGRPLRDLVLRARAAAWRRSASDAAGRIAIRPALLAVVLVVVFPVLMILQPVAVARAYSPLVPIACLCAAAGVGWFACVTTRSSRAAAVVQVCLLILLSADLSARAAATAEPPGGIPAACAFLARQGGRTAVPTGFKYAAYWGGGSDQLVRGDAFHAGPAPDATLRALQQAGVRWFVCDPQYFHYAEDGRLFQWWDELNTLLRSASPPVAEFEHILRSRWSFLAEGPGPDRLPAMQRARAGPIRVYDLSRIDLDRLAAAADEGDRDRHARAR